MPDRSEATARQLLANKDLNQEFGQNYSTAMRNRFGDSAGVAAYNAGPGAVERNMGRNQGQFNVAQAPQETQGYLDKVMRGVGNVVNTMIPSAQASTLQQPPANVGSSGFEAYDRNRPGNAAYEGAPVAQPFMGQTDEFGGMEEPRMEPVAPQAPEAVAQEQAPIPTAGGVGIRMPGQPSGVSSSAGAIDTYQKVQDNPQELFKLGYSEDPNVPDFIKERSRNRAADLVTQKRLMDKAEQQVAAMSPTDTAKVMRKKTEEGSAVKLFIYKMLRMEGSAAEESDKLGFGRETAVMGADGKAYLIKIGESGKPLSGYSADTQKELTQDELIKVAAGATSQKGTEVEAGTYMDPTGKVSGNWVLERKPGGSQYRQVGTGKIATEEQANSLRKTGVAGTLSDQLASQRQKLQEQTRYLAPQEALKFYGKFDAENGTRFAEEYKANNPQYFTPEGTLKPGVAQGGAIAPTALPAGTAGAVQAPAGGSVAPGQLPAAQASGVSATTPGGQKPLVAQSPADIQSAREREKEKQKVERELGQKSSEGVLKHVNENVVPASMAAADGSDAVKRQFKIINEPTSDALFGLYNKAQSNSTKDKNWAIIRDWLGGKLDPNDQTKISEALAKVKLDSTENSAATLYLAENTRLANAMIKSGAYGTGASISTSDRESAERAQLDINTTPALAVFAGKSQQLFGFDVARAKMDWAADKKYDSVGQMEKDWSRQQAKLVEQYGKVADERNAFIKANSDNKPATIGLVRKAYQMYPVPQYDPNLNAGAGGWRNMRDRKLSEILKGNQ